MNTDASQSDKRSLQQYGILMQYLAYEKHGILDTSEFLSHSRDDSFWFYGHDTLGTALNDRP